MADGTVKIATELDTSGAESGVKKLSSSLKSNLSSVDSSTSKTSKGIENLASGANKSLGSIDGSKAASSIDGLTSSVNANAKTTESGWQKASVALGQNKQAQIEAASVTAETTAQEAAAHQSVGDVLLGLTGSYSSWAAIATAGLGAAAAAAVSLANQSVQAYATFEQVTGGVETLYKEDASKLEAYAQEAYKTAGLSANDYLEQATSFGASLVSSLGGDTAAAVELANTAMVDMSDNANKMGTDIGNIQTAYQGFAKQNYTMLDNLKLGYGGTKSEMERLIEDANNLKAANGEVADLSIENYGDVVEAIHLVQESLGITGTTAQEASTTIEGSAKQSQAAWENFLTALAAPELDTGAALQTLLDSGITQAELFIQRFAEVIINGIPQALTQMLEMADQALGTDIFSTFGETVGVAFQAIGSVIQVVVDILTALWTVIQPIVEVLATIAEFVIGTLLQAITAFMSEALQPLLENVSNVITSITGYIQAIWDYIGTFISAIVQFFTGDTQGALDTMTSLFGNLPGAIMGFLSGLLSSIGSWVLGVANYALQAGSQFLSNLVSFISSVPGTVLGFLGNVISNVANFAGQMASGAINAASQFASNIISGISSIPGQVADIGWQIVQGIANGITSAAGAVVSAITGVVGGAINAAKSFLGIASPSKKAKKEIGRWIPLGVAVGAEDEEQEYQARLEKVLDVSSLKVGLPTIALEAAAGMKEQVVSVVQNFNQPVQTPDEYARTMRMQGMYGLAGAV